MHSEELRNLARFHRSLNKSYGDISNILNISRYQVINLIKYKKKVLKSKRGPKFQLNKKTKLQIRRFINKEALDCNKVTCNRIISEVGLHVSRRVVNNYLLHQDYKYAKQAQTISLSKNHKALRLKMVSLWIERNIIWEEVIFSDEKRFTLDGPDNWLVVECFLKFNMYFKCLYCRFSYVPKNVHINRQRRHSQGGGLMVWGMVMPNGLITVKEVQNKFNAGKYLELLTYFTVPIINLNYKNYHFVQDNCSVHTAGIISSFMMTKNIKTIDWPSKSPDLNIMENIWKILSDEVYSHVQPVDTKDLRQKIMQSVRKVNEEKRHIVKGLYDTFRRRLVTVIKTKGNLCCE